MRALGLAVFALGLISCGEVDDNAACSVAADCDGGDVDGSYICVKDELGGAEGVCKLRAGEWCVRHSECSSGQCVAGFCQSQ